MADLRLNENNDLLWPRWDLLFWFQCILSSCSLWIPWGCSRSVFFQRCSAARGRGRTISNLSQYGRPFEQEWFLTLPALASASISTSTSVLILLAPAPELPPGAWSEKQLLKHQMVVDYTEPSTTGWTVYAKAPKNKQFSESMETVPNGSQVCTTCRTWLSTNDQFTPMHIIKINRACKGWAGAETSPLMIIKRIRQEAAVSPCISTLHQGVHASQ